MTWRDLPGPAPVVLDVLAMIALGAGQAERVLLRDRPVAAARRTLTAIAGRSSPSRAQRARGPALVDAGPGHLVVQACCRRSRVPGGPGRSACSAAGPAQRHGGETPAARAGIPDFPSGGHRRRPRRGPAKAGELRLLEWEVAAPQGGAAPRQQHCPARQAGQRAGLPRRRTHLPARLCVPGGPALRHETGSLRVTPAAAR